MIINVNALPCGTGYDTTKSKFREYGPCFSPFFYQDCKLYYPLYGIITQRITKACLPHFLESDKAVLSEMI